PCSRRNRCLEYMKIPINLPDLLRGGHNLKPWKVRDPFLAQKKSRYRMLVLHKYRLPVNHWLCPFPTVGRLNPLLPVLWGNQQKVAERVKRGVAGELSRCLPQVVL